MKKLEKTFQEKYNLRNSLLVLAILSVLELFLFPNPILRLFFFAVFIIVTALIILDIQTGYLKTLERSSDSTSTILLTFITSAIVIELGLLLLRGLRL